MGSQRNDRGSFAVEMVFITPAVLLILALVAVGGRMASAHGEVEGAARDAARAASLSRGDARADALAAAEAVITNDSQHCVGGPKVSLDHDPVVGQPVVATVTCTVQLTGLGLPSIANRSVTATVAAPVDQYVAPR
ncbi:MAG: hypothetical protein DLM59_09005 [Pseudonocardiales bacterium]|nr:MAG: hypothetical protein DLM59_09005 [Pseudonocardiales bacterium]